MLLPKKELSIQVADLYMVRVSEDQVSVALRAETNHGEVFQELTAYRSGTNHEDFSLLNLVDKLTSQNEA